jgi:hypothetical protein
MIRIETSVSDSYIPWLDPAPGILLDPDPDLDLGFAESGFNLDPIPGKVFFI